MTLQTERSGAGWQQPPPVDTPRLRLKPKALPTGYVDGAWWPHSDDLVAEVPDLVAVLSVRLGPIDRVIYHLEEWQPAPRRMTIDGRAIRLAGYHRQPKDTIEVQGVDRKRLILAVVPPTSDDAQAHDAMMAAASPDNDSTVQDLLTTAARSH
jgi:hypothetical protein